MMSEMRNIHPVSRLPEMVLYECATDGWLCEDTATTTDVCKNDSGHILTTAQAVTLPINCAGEWYRFVDPADGQHFSAKLV